MNKTFKKIMSILLCCIMVLGMIPQSAFAVENQSDDVVVTTVVNGYYDENGKWIQGGDGSATYEINDTPVTLSKIAVPVKGAENTYDITLQVRTSTSVTTKTGSGAVVLVIDTSSSMKSCAECGGRERHKDSCEYNGSVATDLNRLTAAKAAAREFLASYSGTDANASRMLAIVTFDAAGNTRLNWANVAGGAGKNSYDQALATINGLDMKQGTNMEGGLYQALGLLDDTDVDGISSKSVVMLSDGAPSYRIGNSDINPSKADCDAAANQATAIKNTGAKLYTVCFGAAKDSAYTGGPTVSAFLIDSVASSGCAYDADNSAALAAAFKSITEKINSGLSGEGWTTTDPMTDYVGVASDTGENFYTDDDKTYTWELTDAYTELDVTTTYYVYSYTYRVTFDPQFKGFEEGKYYPTNERTYLNIDGKQYEFPVPGVTAKLPRTDVSVTKVWDDGDNQDGMRTESVTVQLKDGNSVIGDPVVLDQNNGWSYTWDGDEYDLFIKSEGKVHNYTVEEVDVPEGYTPEVTAKGYAFTITNTHTPEVVTVAGTKTWADGYNRDGKRPASITINLLANGKVIDSKVVTANDNWAWSFSKLPKFQAGQEIKYTITEDPVENYTTKVEGFNVTNTHALEKVFITVTKEWDDNNNQDGIRPEAVIVKLLGNGKDTGETMELNADNNWTGSFNERYKFENGAEIVYTVAEISVEGYETEITGKAEEGFTITNTHEPEETKVPVTKVWVDSDDQDGKRPEAITVKLLANGTDTGKTLVLNETNNWTDSFTDLDKFANGEKIEYTVEEIKVDGYDIAITGNAANGYTITNSHTPGVVAVAGSKTWDDNRNQDGARPESITINLLANGNVIDTITVTEADNWAWSFTGLPQYEAGVEINYSITETAVEGYTTEYDGFNVINTHAPAKTSVTVSKAWNDNNDQDGIRPDSVTVKLLANGEATGDELDLNQGNNWTGSFAELDKFANGAEITYTVEEITVDGYTTVINGDAAVGFTITNTHVPETVSVEGAKTWVDNDNQDGFRPESITINLLKNGQEIDSKVVTAENNWAWSFENLPKKENHGQLIEYAIAEAAVEDYTTEYDGFNVINTHAPEKTAVNVSKAWNDNNDQDGVRPDSITVKLLANGEATGKTLTLSAENNWTDSFADLDKFANGAEITYTVEENKVDDYTTVIAGGAAEGFTITNTHIPEVVEVVGSKTWDDKNNQDGIRPASITINLNADGEVIDTVTVTAKDEWAWNFENLPKYKDHGTEIVYTISEDAVEGYTAEVKGFNVINTHTPAKTSVTVSKAWADSNNQDGIRPDAVTVLLLADGEATGDELVLSEGNDWAGSFTDLDKFQAGKEIAYTVTELQVAGYTPVISGSAANGYNVTNTHAPAQTSVTVSKVWNDNDDQDGIRPNDITVVLLANGEATDKTLVLSEGNKWTGSFTELDKFQAGEEIVYTVVELEVAGYTPVISGSAANGYTITNSHTPETVSVEGAKTWVDNDDQDGARPESITINLLADGVVIDSKTVTAEDKWAWSFTDLPKFKDHGTAIVYSITEAAVEGYTTTYNGYNVVNTHAPAKTSVTVTKAWNDNNNQDGIRANDITVKLLANGADTGKTLVLNQGNNWTGSFSDLDKFQAGQEIAYTVAEISVPGYATVITGSQAEGYTITNTHTPEVVEVAGSKTWDDNNNQDGFRPESITINLLKNGQEIDSKVVTAEDNWAWSFENLPKYENGGTLINYSITEDAVENYTTAYNGYDVVNTHAPEKTSVTVTKSWQDNNDQDGIRANDVTVVLLANGEKTDKTLVLNQGNSWTGSFTELDKFEAGVVINYTVAEISVPGYATVITGTQAEGYTITNSHTPETVSVEGAKTWVDNDDQDGARPESITINLLKGGEVIKTVTVTEADGWAWSFENLPKYENHGKLIEYAITETAVEDYSTEYNGFNVTNTHTPAQTSVTVSKAWQDSNDQDGIRPEAITVSLLANGEETGKTLVLNETNNWTGSFTELDKFEAGEEIAYTVAEISVPGYATVITGTQAEGYTITNSHTPETVSVDGAKTWVDNDDQDGARPESITINLLADGVVIDSKTVTAEDKWAWSFTDLPKFKDHGTAIVYSITEAAVEGYTTTYNGYNVVNTHAPAKTSVTVTKAWADSNNQDGIRPNDIAVKLLANGADTGKTLVLNQGNNWTGSFAELDKFQAGKEIAYTVAEIQVPGYATVITGTQAAGYTITNSHTPAVVEVAGSKTWVDNDNQDGVRPASITVNLLKNGQIIDSKVVTAEDNWAWAFTNLPKNEAGQEIVYSITENAVEGYTTEYHGYNVVNTHAPKKTSVTVAKAWLDHNDQDGIRPNDITVKLLANGKDTGKTLVLSQGNNWTGSFTGLDKFKRGEEIVYTVEEVMIPGYSSEITGTPASGYTITNTHIPAVVNVAGHKTWIDNNNQDGIRPASITIHLLADGKVIDTKIVTAADGWAWNFGPLPQYKDHGTPIVYAVVEAPVDGYVTTYNGYNVINTHAPDKTCVTVTKAWQDNNDQDGIRPNDIVVKLLANGADTGRTLVLSQGNNWTGTFALLDKFEAGKEIVYTVEEVLVEGYNSVITGTQADGYTITNSHTPAVVAVEGTKTWVDNDNQDGVRPASININLIADGQMIDSKIVTAEDNWAWAFTNLPQYKDHGTAIVYAVTENAVEDYSTEYDGYNVINTHAPAQTSVTVTKVWQDNNDQDGIRPEEVTVVLVANGHKTLKTLKLSAENNWTGSFTELDKFKDGEEIVYTLEEKSVKDYESVITGDAVGGYTVTNTHNPETVDVAGSKTWKDKKNQDGARPESITVHLLKNGQVIDTKVVTEADDWAWSFEGLAKYENGGNLINYAISEDAVEGYSTEYKGYDIINTHTPERTSVTVTKTWADKNDAEGLRPGRVTIVLYADGEKVERLKLSDKNNWTDSFTDLPKYKDGQEIVYTIEEVEVDGYNTVIRGDMKSGFQVTNSRTYIPQTGDNRNPVLWISMITMAAFAMAGVMVVPQRKKRRS